VRSACGGLRCVPHAAGGLLVEDEDSFAHLLRLYALVGFLGLGEGEGVGEDLAERHSAIYCEAGALRHQLCVEGPAAEHGELAVDDVGRHLERRGAVGADIAGSTPRPGGPGAIDAGFGCARAFQRRVGALTVGQAADGLDWIVG